MPLSQISITQRNQECLNLISEKKYFNNEISIAQFAAIYLLRNYEIDNLFDLPIDKYIPISSYSNNKWHLSDVDNDGFIRKSLVLFDPKIEDSDYALRAAVSLGLDKIFDIIRNKSWDILELL